MQNEQLRDDLDKQQIEQLHQVVLRLSANSFEIKKLCITVIVSAAVVFASFTDRQLGPFLFAAPAIIIAFFYMLDVQVYYYQMKIRLQMQQIHRAIAERHFPSVEASSVGMPLTDPGSQIRRLKTAFLNHSMWPYAMLGAMDFILFGAYSMGFFQSWT